MDQQTLDRFEALYIPEPNSGCWLWLGHIAGSGKKYGYFRIGGRKENGGRDVRAHRFSYESFIGPIPYGAVLDHTCKVTCCVNPSHLEPVTQKENVKRGRLSEVQKNRRR